jgi:4-cresol dehydrogenase (hydroxylating)
VHLFNAPRLIAGIERFPWQERDGTTAVTADELLQLRRKHGIPAWLGTGSLSGTTDEVGAVARALRRALRGIASLHFIDDWRMRLMETVGGWFAALGFPRLHERAAKLRVLYDLLQGKPSSECLEGARWRVRPNGRPLRSADPLDHHAGLLWLSPVLPMTRDHVQRVTALTEPLFARFGFEYQVTFSAVSARALCAVMSIAYNKTDATETRRAQACYQKLLNELMTAGYVPYRLGNLSVPELAMGSKVFWDVAAEIKAALDPRGILSPGHYEPLARPGWEKMSKQLT